MAERPSPSPEELLFGQETLKAAETKTALGAPKTAERWCNIFKALSGRDVYKFMNWGDKEESEKLLTFSEFSERGIRTKTSQEDLPLILAINKMIKKTE